MNVGRRAVFVGLAAYLTMYRMRIMNVNGSGFRKCYLCGGYVVFGNVYKGNLGSGFLGLQAEKAFCHWCSSSEDNLVKRLRDQASYINALANGIESGKINIRFKVNDGKLNKVNE